MKEIWSSRKREERTIQDKKLARVNMFVRILVSILMFIGSAMVAYGLHNIWIGVGMSIFAFGVLFV